MSLPASVESIGSKAFSGCLMLSRVSMGNGVRTIGSGAFMDCRSLLSAAFRPVCAS